MVDTFPEPPVYINCYFKCYYLVECGTLNVEALSLCVGSFYIELFHNSKESNESQEM